MNFMQTYQSYQPYQQMTHGYYNNYMPNYGSFDGVNSDFGHSYSTKVTNNNYLSFQNNAFGGNDRYVNSDSVGISSYFGGIKMTTNILETINGIDFGPK